jgi:acetyl esterase/lipase
LSGDKRAAPAALDPALFRAQAVPPEVRAMNEAMQARLSQAPKWWQLGATKARALGIMPRQPSSLRARTLSIAAPDGRAIALRLIAPERIRGVYLHLHGGGFVLGGADHQDSMLERIADAAGLACLSVEYRLAPEHPYPAAWDDCEAAALWLVRNARQEFGTDVLLMGGESAGAAVAVPTLVRLRDRHSCTAFRGVNLNCGTYDARMTPSQLLDDRLVLTSEDIRHCLDAYAPDPSSRSNPEISSLFADLRDLPPALFTVGTRDAFLDDSLFMYCRWIAAGNRAEIVAYPGAGHAFTDFPGPLAAQANARIDAFLTERASG